MLLLHVEGEKQCTAVIGTVAVISSFYSLASFMQPSVEVVLIYCMTIDTPEIPCSSPNGKLFWHTIVQLVLHSSVSGPRGYCGEFGR